MNTKTLISSVLGDAYSQGANAAFEQVAEMARTALEFHMPEYEKAPGETLAKLMSFYDVYSMEKLIEAQAEHVKQLQLKLPPFKNAFPTSPRR